MRPNVYSGGAIDRGGPLRHDPEWLAAQLAAPSSRLVPVWRDRSLVRRNAEAVHAACPPVGSQPWLHDAGIEPVLLGLLGGVAHFAADLTPIAGDLPASLLADQGEFVDLRSVGPLLSQGEGALLAYARAITHWHRTQLFCGRCGAPAASRDGGHVRTCISPSCGTQHFPRTDPAVIVLVSCQGQCLLGRQSKWSPGMFSTLAGFVEPGETMEEAVMREVMEETGVPVLRVRYHSSQPWPFPASLMIGFMAEAERLVEPSIDPRELEAACWFSPADIARFGEHGRSLPRLDSIARRLIEDWLSTCP